MIITFDNKKLEKLANNDRAATAELGKLRATKFKQRLSDLFDSITLEDTRYLPGNFHELKTNRKGSWACDLDQPYRLIFRPNENPIPIDGNGRYIWSAIKSVEILEIVNYHN
ncbi:MAG: killer suppression protein HigA [Bacteroidia bacterium]|nr:killer suppression protein HigA [Bacteroidia bacterium]